MITKLFIPLLRAEMISTFMGQINSLQTELRLLSQVQYKYERRRGRVLERLAVVRKVAGSRPARAKRLENSHCPPSSEWVPD